MTFKTFTRTAIEKILACLGKQIQINDALSRRIDILEGMIKSEALRRANESERITDIEKDIKRTWDHLGVTKVPTDKPSDTHILKKSK